MLAADYFWNGGDGPPPADLPYRPADVFARQWGDVSLPVAKIAKATSSPSSPRARPAR